MSPPLFNTETYNDDLHTTFNLYKYYFQSVAAVAIEQKRLFSVSAKRFQEDGEEEGQGEEEEATTEVPVRPVHDVDTSQRYMQSKGGFVKEVHEPS